MGWGGLHYLILKGSGKQFVISTLQRLLSAAQALKLPEPVNILPGVGLLQPI